MIIRISREPTFDVPEGKYRAVLTEVINLEDRKTKTGWADQVRLLFEIVAPQAANTCYLVGKNYEPSLAKNSDLRKDLAGWRGYDLTEQEIAAGSVNLESMIGKEADIKVAHIKNEGFPKPYVFIKAIRPPGTFIAANNKSVQVNAKL